MGKGSHWLLWRDQTDKNGNHRNRGVAKSVAKETPGCGESGKPDQECGKMELLGRRAAQPLPASPARGRAGHFRKAAGQLLPSVGRVMMVTVVESVNTLKLSWTGNVPPRGHSACSPQALSPTFNIASSHAQRTDRLGSVPCELYLSTETDLR